MEEWKEYKLGELYDVHNGLSKGGKFFGSGYPFLSFSTVFKNYFLPNELTNLVQSSEKEQANFNIKEGDVFITRTSESADELGMSSVALKDYPNATYNGFTKRLRPKGVIEISSKYIGYYLRSPKFRSNFYKLTSAMSTRASLANNDLLNMIVSIPSLQTQQKIANILSSLDDKIEVNRRINEQLEELAQALFKSWFVDFEPFKDGEFVESELGMIPEGWKVGTLGNVADVVMGASPAGSSYNTEGNGSIFYQGRTDFGFRFPNVRMYTTEPKRFAESNSVLLSVRAPVGDVNIAFEKCCIGRGLASIKSNCNADSFTYYLMKNLKPVLDNYNNEGTVFGCINKDALNNLSIVVPTNEIIKEFENVVSSFDVEIRRRSEEITHLTNLRDTLLPKLMSGEIDVNDVEI